MSPLEADYTISVTNTGVGWHGFVDSSVSPMTGNFQGVSLAEMLAEAAKAIETDAKARQEHAL